MYSCIVLFKYIIFCGLSGGLNICINMFNAVLNFYLRDHKDHVETRERLVRLESGDRRVTVDSLVFRVFLDLL